MNRAFHTITALSLLLAACVSYAQTGDNALQPHPKWSKETVHIFSTLPIQEGGRIKPLSTFAGFKLLGFSGRRSCKDLADNRITATEWLMDVMFYPEAADRYRVFSIQTTDVLDAIGVKHEGRKKRDRYSYSELHPGRNKLFELAQSFDSIPAEKRSLTQQQIINLAHDVDDYLRLRTSMDFARAQFPTRATEGLQLVFSSESECLYSSVLSQAPLLARMVATLEGMRDIDSTRRDAEMKALEDLLSQVDRLGSYSDVFRLFPPNGTDADEAGEWLSPGGLVPLAFLGQTEPKQQIALVRHLENLTGLLDDRDGFLRELSEMHSEITDMARARGEASKVDLEVQFYNAKLFSRSLAFFICCFLFIALTWFKPSLRSLNVASAMALLVPLAFLAVGITMRCIIRGRPPVTTLYETILFTTAVCVLVAIVIELMTRQKIAVSVGAFLGAVGMFIANKYEIREGVDTMPSLVAVLDTNFWLATHVTTISMGYAAGLLSSAIAHVYILGKLLGWKRNDIPFYQGISRMTYGTLCFGLFFAVLGTVLGGIWANESWGRFWGWDPKENGALLIILWMSIVLHARLGGYIRDLGINISAVLCGLVVAFSWWGVNLLGVGLHSYGFTSGILRTLVIFNAVEVLVACAGVLVWLRERDVPARPARNKAK